MPKARVAKPKPPQAPKGLPRDPALRQRMRVESVVKQLFGHDLPGREVMGKGRPGSVTAKTRRYGAELQDAVRRWGGAEPPSMPKKSYPRDPQARAKRQRALAQSPLIIQALKERLTGARIGSPRKTADDVRRLAHLSGLGQAIGLDEEARKRKTAGARERLRRELEGETGVLRRILTKAGRIAGRLFGRKEKAFERLTPDKIAEGLKGLGIGPPSAAPRAPQRAAGMIRETPYQSAPMIAVSSSNVASIGWEPHQPNEPQNERSLGTLYVQFRNGWMYKYVDAPKWLYDALLRAGSKGKAVWAMIRRGLYPDGVPYGSAAVEGYERIE